MTFLLKSFSLVLKHKFCHIGIPKENELVNLRYFQKSDDDPEVNTR